jgi:hypothetical protein
VLTIFGMILQVIAGWPVTRESFKTTYCIGLICAAIFFYIIEVEAKYKLHASSNVFIRDYPIIHICFMFFAIPASFSLPQNVRV